MRSYGLNTKKNNYYYVCVSRISLHQTHIELNNGIVGHVKYTNISEAIVIGNL